MKMITSGPNQVVDFGNDGRTSSSGLKTGFEAVKQSLILKGSWLIVE